MVKYFSFSLLFLRLSRHSLNILIDINNFLNFFKQIKDGVDR
jgi:hypothetical protein